MEDVGIFYGHLVYFMAIWSILWLFGIFFHVLVCCPKKNLATLVPRLHSISKQQSLQFLSKIWVSTF
jgi:hypothetical protein